jgi:GAF domain-containing protein
MLNAPVTAPEPLSASLFEQTAQRALQLLDSRAPQTAILTCLAGGAELAAGGGAVCSILLLDREGLLRNGASPNLPRDYLDAIDRIKPDPDFGTCAAAAATGSIVFTPDFYADDKWAELRHLPLQLGFLGAWSCPIVSLEGAVLGTFGTYFRERRLPSPEEIEGVCRLAEIAATVVSR